MAVPTSRPDDSVVAPAVPRTRTSKKLEVPIKRLMQGTLQVDAMATSAINHADVLSCYEHFAKKRVRQLL